MADPIITKIELHTYECERENLGTDYNGFNTVYEPGNRIKSQGNVLRVQTDQGIVGEYAGGRAAEFSTIPIFAHFLIGRSALQRELINTEVKRALRQVARIGLALSTSRCGTSPANSTINRSTSCWAATRTASPATPAPTTAITSPTASRRPRRSPTSPNSASNWAIPPSRSTAGAARPSARKWPTSTPSASASAAKWT